MDEQFEVLKDLDKRIEKVVKEIETRFGFLLSSLLIAQTEYENSRSIDTYVNITPYLMKESKELMKLAREYRVLVSIRRICEDYMSQDECRRYYEFFLED